MGCFINSASGSKGAITAQNHWCKLILHSSFLLPNISVLSRDYFANKQLKEAHPIEGCASLHQLARFSASRSTIVLLRAE